MKKMIFIIIMAYALTSVESSAQLLRDIQNVFNQDDKLSDEDASAGIREALIKGTNVGVDNVSDVDGYFGNPEIKIPFPPEAQEMEKTLRNIGLGSKVDEAVLSINRAAELAANEARPIFISAITHMTVIDAIDIVRGSDNAATAYLQRTTSAQLIEAFHPIIAGSLEQVEATRYWDDIVNTYNMIPFVKRMDPDLASYVTGRAIEGLFIMIAQEELRIRQDPLARTTELLKKVFGSN